MKKRSKTVITVSAIAVFIAAFLLCTFYDYQISEAIARLTDGNYLSDNKFGIFFEIIGETPMYIIGVFSACNIIRKGWKAQRPKIKIAVVLIFTVAAVVAYTIMIERMVGYACENAGKEDYFEKIKAFIWVGSAVIGIGLVALTYYLTCKIPERYLNGLVIFSMCALFTILFSQVVVQVVKSIVGRQRYRTMKVLEYYGLGEFVDYSKWFVIHGKRSVSSEMLALGIASDGYKSFPSGHTCSWAVLFTLTVLPDFLNLDEKKRVKLKGILIVSTVLAVLLMAYTRILVGAHFATDTLFAAGITYFAVIISKNIANKIKVKMKLQ